CRPQSSRTKEYRGKGDAGENHIHGDAGGDDRHALPDRLVFVTARIIIVAVRSFVAVHLPNHLHIAAKRKDSQFVSCLSPGMAAEWQRGAEPDAKGGHMNVATFCDQKMAEFVNEN